MDQRAKARRIHPQQKPTPAHSSSNFNNYLQVPASSHQRDQPRAKRAPQDRERRRQAQAEEMGSSSASDHSADSESEPVPSKASKYRSEKKPARGHLDEEYYSR